MRGSLRGSKRFYMIISVFILLFTYCTTVYEDLTSKNHDRSIVAADQIIAGDIPRGTDIEVDKILSLLHSDSVIISRAAQLTLMTLKKQSAWNLLSLITNTSYYKNMKYSNAIEVMSFTNRIDDPVNKADIISLIAEKVLSVDEVEGLELINMILKEAENTEDYETRIQMASFAISALVAWNPRMAEIEVSNQIELIQSQSRETPKATGIGYLLPALVVTEDYYFSNEIQQLIDIVDDFYGGSTTAIGYRHLAENIYPIDPARGLKLAKKINIDWNSSYYDEALAVAVSIAEIKPFHANQVFRVAYQMAKDINDDEEQRQAILDIGTQWAKYDTTHALSVLESLKGNDSDWAELLGTSASYVVDTDYDQAMFYLDLIIFDSNRAKAVSQVASALACFNRDSDWSFTNDCSKPLQVLNSVIRSLPDSDPERALEIIENNPFDTTNQVDVLSRLGVYYEESKPDLSKEIFQRIIYILNTNENETNRMINITNMSGNLSRIRNYSTYDLWESLIEAANDLLGIFSRKTAMKIAARDYYLYDPIESVDYNRYMDSQNYYQIALHKLTNRFWLREAEVLAEMDWGNISNLFPVLMNTDIDEPILINAIYLKLLNGSISNPSKQLLGLEEVFLDKSETLFDDNSYTFEEEDIITRWIDILGLIDNDKSREIMFSILTNSNAVLFHKDVLDSFDDNDTDFINDKSEILLTYSMTNIYSDNIRENCLKLLSYSDNISEEKLLELSNDNYPDSVIAEVMKIYSETQLFEMTDWIAGHLIDDDLCVIAAKSLAELDAKQKLVSMYTSYKSEFNHEFAILEALKLNYPSDMVHDYLGYYGYIYVNAIQEAMLKGYDCLDVDDYEHGLELGCTRFIEGDYDVDLGDTLTYFDNNYPDGQVVITNQIHRVKVYYKNENDIRLWYISATGWGAAWSMEEVEIMEGLDLQQLVVQQAEKQVLKTLKKSLKTKAGSISFNY